MDPAAGDPHSPQTKSAPLPIGPARAPTSDSARSLLDFSAAAYSATPPRTFAPGLPPTDPASRPVPIVHYATPPGHQSSVASSVPIPIPKSSSPSTSGAFSFSPLDDEHVTVWDPSTGKTVAGNAAPYRRNLSTWLANHPGWLEKADELKSSKRRSAGRRARAAASAFASLCAYEPVCAVLTARLEEVTTDGSIPNSSSTSSPEWTQEELVRLEESLVRLGYEIFNSSAAKDPGEWWPALARAMGTARPLSDLLPRAHAVLVQGVETLRQMSAARQRSDAFAGVPASMPAENELATAQSFHRAPSGPSDLPAFPVYRGAGGIDPAILGPNSLDDICAVFEKSFRNKRERRITVWDPSTGRTISGNAAPSERNLSEWIRAHPGWEAKPEEHLSSARRSTRDVSRRHSGDARLPRPVPIPGRSLPTSAAMDVARVCSVDSSYGSEHDAVNGLLMLLPNGPPPETAQSVPDSVDPRMFTRPPRSNHPANSSPVDQMADTDNGQGDNDVEEADDDDDDDDDDAMNHHVRDDDVENPMEMD